MVRAIYTAWCERQRAKFGGDNFDRRGELTELLVIVGSVTGMLIGTAWLIYSVITK